MTQYGFLFDQRYCIGCQACQTACQVRNGSPVGTSLREAVSFEDNPEGPFMTMSCNHCENPACVANCPTGAMTKDPETGIVSVDKEVCIKCGSCANACPYHAPKIVDELDYSSKCDFCADRLAAGELPACVNACPVKILIFGELSELDEQGVAEAPGFTVEDTNPCVRFIVA